MRLLGIAVERAQSVVGPGNQSGLNFSWFIFLWFRAQGFDSLPPVEPRFKFGPFRSAASAALIILGFHLCLIVSTFFC